jgi:large subunit ribosomal protein LP0
MPLSAQRKEWYFDRLKTLLDTYTKILLVQCDNVGSNQMAQIRFGLRGKAEMLMGKNTMMRKIILNYLKDNPGHPYENLLPRIKGNIGFIFTNGDMNVIQDVVAANVVPAPARVGAFAPTDVMVPPGPTGCDPGQTSFFQVLQIPTKISKGQIEIVSEVHLIKKGDRVGNSEAALLQKLDIRPFTYGLGIDSIYDNGDLFDAAVLSITDETLHEKFLAAVRNIASASLSLGYPTLASLPHSVANAFKCLVAVAVECEEYSFAKADPFKAYLKDPSAFASAAPSGGGGGGAAAAAPEPEEEEEEADMGAAVDMFGGGGGGDY